MTVDIGTEAPDFELVNQYGQPVRLSSFRGVKPVALVFYPLAFSGTCTGELCELRDNFADFQSADVELLAVSVDSKFAIKAWSEQMDYPFTLLADFWPHGAVARQYGVFLEDKGQANRATFVIDTAGTVRDRFITEPGVPRPLAAYQKAIATVTGR